MATITEAGTANELIKYTNGTDLYFPKAAVGAFSSISGNRISLCSGAYEIELQFDDDTQRNTAMTALLSYF